MQRNFGLDLLRAVAISSVLLLHVGQGVKELPEVLRSLFEYGWVGVDLFFVLSGYLIAGQLFRSDSRGIVQFWTRRWTRTLPLYFVVLGVYIFLKPLALHKPMEAWDWRFFFFLQNFLEPKDFIQSWSLCIEEQFYLIFPLVYFLIRPKWAFFWLIPLLVSILIRASILMSAAAPIEGAYFDIAIRFRTLTHLDGLAVGVFLAATRDLWVHWSAGKKRRVGFTGFGIVLLSGFLFSSTPGLLGGIFYFSFLALGFGLALIYLESYTKTPSGFSWVQPIAIWSYGAYLWNHFYMSYFIKFPLPVHWTLQSLAFLLSVFLTSWLTYMWVEKPGLKIREWRHE